MLRIMVKQQVIAGCFVIFEQWPFVALEPLSSVSFEPVPLDLWCCRCVFRTLVVSEESSLLGGDTGVVQLELWFKMGWQYQDVHDTKWDKSMNKIVGYGICELAVKNNFVEGEIPYCMMFP